MKRLVYLLIASLSLTSAARAALIAPDGWTSTDNASGFTATPKDLSDGQRVTFRVTPTQKLSGDFRTWFERTVNAMNVGEVVAFGGQIQGAKPTAGIELLTTDVVTRNLKGVYTYHRYAAAAMAAGTVELIDFSASSVELLEKHTNAYSEMLNKWRDERLAPALVDAIAKTLTDTKVPPELQAVEKVKESARKAGYVTGSVTNVDGKPIAGANIKILVDGVTLRGGERSWFEISPKADGTFEQRVPDGLYRVTAELQMDYNGLPIKMPLEGQDGEPAATRLDSTAGIVKDFRLRVLGLKAGGDKNNVYSWFGSAIGLHTERNLLDGGLAGNRHTIRERFPNAKYELKLVPVGPLLDGRKGDEQSYTFAADWLGNGFGKSNRYFQNIAIGRYKMTATMILPDGTRKAVKLNLDGDPKPNREELDVVLTSGAYIPVYLEE